MTECDSGEDEANCPDIRVITFVVLLACLLMFFIISATVIHFTDLHIHTEGSFPIFEYIGDRDLRDLIVLYRESDQGKTACRELYERLLNQNGGSRVRVLNVMKVGANLMIFAIFKEYLRDIICLPICF